MTRGARAATFTRVVAQIDSLETSFDSTVAWLDELTAQTGASRSSAYHVLAAVLHTLRDNLTVAQGAELAHELPIVVTGVFYESWEPGRVPSRRPAATGGLMERLREDAGIGNDDHASRAIACVVSLLRREIDTDVFERTLASLPPDVRHVLNG